MKCGHSANATYKDKPCCVICSPDLNAYLLDQAPKLTNRKAKCSCGCIVASSTELAFFEYRGTGSKYAIESCKCGYTIPAHEHNKSRVDPRSVIELGKCKGFVAKGGHEYDSYYCGHAGWD